MAIATAPTVVNNQSYNQWAGVAGGDRAAHSAPALAQSQTGISAPQRVGSVTVQPGDNTTVPLGGRFDIWYDRSSHSLLIDIVSSQIGGPV